MATLDQLASQIRFQLEQLSERNGHHEFEHLCRHLARARICSNILPATGPVAAFGDQGRDFETFRTYLHESPLANTSFVGLASEGPIAFACTLTRKDDIESKIKSDVDTIMGSGTSVIDVHYFCTADISSGFRHKKLQEWAKEVYGIPLEIHDGQAISEHLTGQDVFWIAQRFLNIPAELYPAPPPDDGEQWYYDLLETWKQEERPPVNYAHFSQIKTAVRHATFTDTAKRDLPFWIDVLELLIDTTPYSTLKRRATYEVAVASLRGLGSLIGREEKLSEYFAEVSLLTTPSDLEDAATLWSYCVGSHYQNASQVTLHELHKWRDIILKKIEAELQTTSQPGKRCLLLQTLGFLSMWPGQEQDRAFGVDQTINSWLELASLAGNAHLFPLEDFADRLTVILELSEFYPFIADHPDFEKLTQQIDELLANRHGHFVAAEKCRDRALALYKQGKLTRAIKEVHKAKIKWFAKETLRGSLLATLFVSNCYQEMGLGFAAKYYALVVAYIAIHSDTDKVQSLISRSLVAAAACDYRLGCYCGFFDFTDAGLAALNTFSTGTTVSDDINASVFHASILRAITARVAPELLSFVDERISNWTGLEDYLDQLRSDAEEVVSGGDVSELWSVLEEQIWDRPYSDVGQFRTAQFSELGVIWKFKWENTYELTAVAEEILAVLQILLADIANADWYLLRTTIETEIRLGEEHEVGIQQLPSNELGRWRLTLADVETTREESDKTAFEVAATLLEHASLLPTKEFVDRIGVAFDEGLAGKTFFGQRYSTVYREFVSKEKYVASNRRSKRTPDSGRPFRPVVHHEIAWHDGPGPGYSEVAATEVLERRYKFSVIPIQRTLKHLSQEPTIKETVRNLRSSGWLDWHILVAISSVALNFRLAQETTPTDNPDTLRQRYHELMYQPEDENAEPVPTSEFSEQHLRNYLHFSMSSTLMHLGFELHQVTPDFEAISDFLGERYNYWTDDVDHPSYGF